MAKINRLWNQSGLESSARTVSWTILREQVEANTIDLPPGRYIALDFMRTKRAPGELYVASVGPIDPQVGLVRLDREDGRPLAVIYNFACHPIMNPPSKGSSADYPGFASKVIEEAHDMAALGVSFGAPQVDLEKLRYSYPPLDLAHATLYTSTTWDVDASFTLSTAQIARAYEVWLSTAGEMAEPYLVAFVPLRELMWLWSVTWCAKWLTESEKPKHASGAGGEDWSQANSDASLIRHVRSRVDDYLTISTIDRVLDEFNELDRLFAHSS